MNAFDYAESPYPIRADIAAAHRSVWQAIARPGNWWTGAERVAIAAEFRRARGVAVDDHPADGLPSAALDAVHRLAVDLHHLSQSWYEGLLAEGLTDGQYVEIVSIASFLSCLDGFCQALGLPPEPLPAPEPGEPSHYRPADAIAGEAWVPMIPEARPDGSEADIYHGARRTAHVIMAMSLVPDAVRLLGNVQTAHYVTHGPKGIDMSEGERAITRAQIEFVAGRVSAINQCFY